MQCFLRLNALLPFIRPIEVLLLYVAACALTIESDALAEIYKYKDVSGQWQYTDRPPSHTQEAEVVKSSARRTTEMRDLANHLDDSFKPKTPIQEAALSVVEIKTGVGRGAGFFVTSDGYILTNKHVVRPNETPRWRKHEDEINVAKSEFQRVEQDLNERRKTMKRAKQTMENLKGIIAKDVGLSRMQAKHQYGQLQAFHQQQQKVYRELNREYKKKKRELRDHDHEFRLQGAYGSTQTHFQIVLRGGLKKRVRLVATSPDHDLALLKLDGHQTPSVSLSDGRQAGVGTHVYAIGSQLGLSGAMTSGVITGKKGDTIFTDAQILPGNSGGPLIIEDGSVVGVNRARLVGAGQSEYSEGLGMAIPISIAKGEFPQIN